MYGKRQTSPCLMCTLWIDGFNAVAAVRRAPEFSRAERRSQAGHAPQVKCPVGRDLRLWSARPPATMLAAMDDGKKQSRPAAVYSGNPRITVGFPFSRIEVHEPVAALTDLAGLLSRLAEQLAQVAHAVSDDAEVADQLADEARLLALRLGAEGAPA